jgi:hypothetical protein
MEGVINQPKQNSFNSIHWPVNEKKKNPQDMFMHSHNSGESFTFIKSNHQKYSGSSFHHLNHQNYNILKIS